MSSKEGKRLFQTSLEEQGELLSLQERRKELYHS